jgi:hypothetical protein
MRDAYMGLWLEILRKSGYLMEFGVEFEYDQFWPNKKEKGKKEKRKNQNMMVIEEINENISFMILMRI